MRFESLIANCFNFECSGLYNCARGVLTGEHSLSNLGNANVRYNFKLFRTRCFHSLNWKSAMEGLSESYHKSHLLRQKAEITRASATFRLDPQVHLKGCIDDGNRYLFLRSIAFYKI